MSGAILTDKTLESKSQKDKNENINENVNENENVNDKTLMSSNEDGDEIIKISMHSHEYAETTNQNEKSLSAILMIKS